MTRSMAQEQEQRKKIDDKDDVTRIEIKTEDL